MTTIVAVLDANVLFPASLRDTLIRASQRGLYRMQWSLEILEEVRRNLVKTKRVAEEKAQRLIDTLVVVFPRALVSTDSRLLIPMMQNDIKDRHVLAAAVACQAQVIVTRNLQDFPALALKSYGIEAQSPDTFLLHLLQDHAAPMAQIITEQAADLRNPPRTVAQEIDNLALHAPTFAQALRDYLAQQEHKHTEET